MADKVSQGKKVDYQFLYKLSDWHLLGRCKTSKNWWKRVKILIGKVIKK